MSTGWCRVEITYFCENIISIKSLCINSADFTCKSMIPISECRISGTLTCNSSMLNNEYIEISNGEC